MTTLYSRFSKGTFNRNGFVSISDMLNTTRYVFSQCLKLRNGAPSFGTWMVYYEDCPFVLKMLVKSHDTSSGFCGVQILNIEHMTVEEAGAYPYSDNVHMQKLNKPGTVKASSTATTKLKENPNVLTDELRERIFGTTTSEILTARAEELGLEVVNVPLAELEHGDLQGMPVRKTSYNSVETIHANEDNASTYHLTPEEIAVAVKRVQSAWVEMKRTDAARSKY